jgi:hypothetical protein
MFVFYESSVMSAKAHLFIFPAQVPSLLDAVGKMPVKVRVSPAQGKDVFPYR